MDKKLEQRIARLEKLLRNNKKFEQAEDTYDYQAYNKACRDAVSAWRNLIDAYRCIIQALEDEDIAANQEEIQAHMKTLDVLNKMKNREFPYFPQAL